ncbi:2OG-Fe(II) oxygenase [Brasilonema sp. UFV-L1]|uniref:2OG-Fe(II) oxygenase n=1 Tax=Brasilonema sp. UFV-L1 TaxID=2234130 RepID=UPI00145DF895|nr:2OG-Fe(II) oxygenase [Brasilonema sp. UFV-L1]NMG07794.1 2OG-Fe(II) oxygenase [Brasilonema sp. UFV-L1]
MQITTNKYYQLRSQTFPRDYLNTLRSQILFSPYLAASQLSDSFAETKGFSVVFKRSSISEVERHFPFFQPYLKVVLEPTCNAFYLNPLVLEGGARVEPHIDCSLSAYGKFIAIPNVVSVLYVQIPPDLQGGELVLQNREHQVAQIQPQTNTLLYFRGNLRHLVNEVKSSQARISLVCEQYNLSESRLQQIPEFEIQYKAVQ